MIRFLTISTLFTVAACATPNVEHSASVQVPEPAGVSQSDEASDPTQSGSPDGDDMIAQHKATGSVDAIGEIEAPEVEETPASMFPRETMAEPAIICERVVPTGSVLPVKVCRSRTEIEQKQSADQKIFDDIKRNTALGNSRL